MSRSLWHELIVDNPVIKDSQRAFWEKANPRHWQTNTTISVGIVGTAYIVLIGMALQAVKDLDASLFFFVALTLAILVSVIVLYGVLSGERERRTLDLLLVAPVTAGQIVAAKLLRIVVPLIAIVVLLTVPAVVFGFARANLGLAPMGSGGNFGLSVLGSMAITVAVGVFVSGVAMFLSSVNRTNAGALAGTLLVLFLVYVVYAVLAAVAGAVNRTLGDVIISIHPYYALSRIMWSGFSGLPPAPVATASVVVHSVVGVVLVVLATRNVERERSKGIRSNA